MTVPVRPAGSGPSAATGRLACLDVVAVAVEMVRRLAKEKSRHGMVNLSELNKILDSFADPHCEFAHAIAAQPAKCAAANVAAAHAAEEGEKAASQTGYGPLSGRRDMFRRLMVRPFEVLLDGQTPAFPREFLPNFFKVLDAGSAGWKNKTENACRTVLQALAIDHGHHLEWEVFYSDIRTRHIMIHSLRQFVSFLETPAGQWMWENALFGPNPNGRRPNNAQCQQLYDALCASWRALEMEMAAQNDSR